MCYSCDEYPYNDLDPYDCDDDCETCYPPVEPEKEEEVVTGPFDGMQYRLYSLGYWKDVEPGQTSFATDSGKIEFRKKPKLVATVTYDTNKAKFFDKDSLARAIEINVQNGTAFTLDVSYE